MEEKSVFEEFDVKNNFIRRRNLLPLWIKIFIWIFLFTALIGIIMLAFGFFINNAEFSIYGLETTQPYSLTGFIISFLFIFKGIAAYGLWFEQDWAIRTAKIDAVLGIGICLFVMLVMPFITGSNYFMIRFEIVFLILFFRKIQKIEEKWMKFATIS